MAEFSSKMIVDIVDLIAQHCAGVEPAISITQAFPEDLSEEERERKIKQSPVISVEDTLPPKQKWNKEERTKTIKELQDKLDRGEILSDFDAYTIMYMNAERELRYPRDTRPLLEPRDVLPPSSSVPDWLLKKFNDDLRTTGYTRRNFIYWIIRDVKRGITRIYAWDPKESKWYIRNNRKQQSDIEDYERTLEQRGYIKVN